MCTHVVHTWGLKGWRFPGWGAWVEYYVVQRLSAGVHAPASVGAVAVANLGGTLLWETARHCSAVLAPPCGAGWARMAWT
jgi:hypothetical protein